MLLVLSEMTSETEQSAVWIWHSLTDSASVSSNIGVIGTLSFLFLAYILGEVLMLLGMAAQRKNPAHLQRFAIAKFINVEGNEVWMQHFSEAERKFELFSGIAATLLILGIGLGLDHFFGNKSVLGLATLIGSLLASALSFSLAKESYNGLSSIMNAVLEARSKDGTTSSRKTTNAGDHPQPAPQVTK